MHFDVFLIKHTILKSHALSPHATKENKNCLNIIYGVNICSAITTIYKKKTYF